MALDSNDVKIIKDIVEETVNKSSRQFENKLTSRIDKSSADLEERLVGRMDTKIDEAKSEMEVKMEWMLRQ